MWFCQGQGYRFHDYRGLFIVLYSTETGSCLKWSCCLRNLGVVLGQGGRGLHKNSASSAKAVHWVWPPCPLLWGPWLCYPSAGIFPGMILSVLWWLGLHCLDSHMSVCLPDMKANSSTGAVLGHPLGSQLQGGKWEHQVRRVTVNSKWVSVPQAFSKLGGWMCEWVLFVAAFISVVLTGITGSWALDCDS